LSQQYWNVGVVLDDILLGHGTMLQHFCMIFYGDKGNVGTILQTHDKKNCVRIFFWSDGVFFWNKGHFIARKKYREYTL
jgi:hypothetical protein